MDASSLPIWAQGAGAVAIVILSVFAGIYKYVKTELKSAPENSTGAVLSASFIDSKLLKELIEVLREHQEEGSRDAKKVIRALQDMREASIENTEALIVQTDTSTNLLKFITKGGANRPTRNFTHE